MIQRQGEAKRGSPVRPLLHPDTADVRAHDTPTDREPEADPAALTLVHAIEFLEDALDVGLVDPRAAIGNLDLDLALQGSRSDVDRAARGGVLDGVLDEVDEHLLDQDRVEGHERQIARDAGADGSAPQPVVEPVEGGADDLLERLRLLLDLERARVEAGHVEQVANEAVQPERLLVRRHDQRAALRFVGGSAVPEERAHGAGHDGEGGSEVVRHRAEKGVSKLLRLGAQGGLPSFFHEGRALERRPDEAREGLEKLHLLGVPHLPCHRRQEPEDTHASPGPVEGHEESRGRGQELGPGAGPALVTPRPGRRVLGPLGCAHELLVGEDRLESRRRLRAGRRRPSRRTPRGRDARRTREAPRASRRGRSRG